MNRIEAVVAGICLGAWLLAAIFLLADTFQFNRFPPPRALFPVAGVIGWLAGNFFVVRSRRSRLGRRGLLALYLGGPPGLLWLYWGTIPAAVRQLSPLAPPLALAVFAIFFLVPVSLRRFPRRG